MANLRRTLTRARNDGFRIVYADETMFTRKTVPQLEWSRKKENPMVDEVKLNEPTLAVLAGISKKNGLEPFMIFKRSVNTDRFIEWLDKLRAASGTEKVIIFMDNLGVHTCKRSRAAMKERKFRWAFNLPYSPE